MSLLDAGHRAADAIIRLSDQAPGFGRLSNRSETRGYLGDGEDRADDDTVRRMGFTGDESEVPAHSGFGDSCLGCAEADAVGPILQRFREGRNGRAEDRSEVALVGRIVGQPVRTRARRSYREGGRGSRGNVESDRTSQFVSGGCRQNATASEIHPGSGVSGVCSAHRAVPSRGVLISAVAEGSREQSGPPEREAGGLRSGRREGARLRQKCCKGFRSGPAGLRVLRQGAADTSGGCSTKKQGKNK